MGRKGDKQVATLLGKSYAIDWRGIPPHMLKPDVPVWYRFLERWGSQLINLWYDVLLGAPVLTEEEEKNSYLKMYSSNISKRADAIAELENEIWIIEVASTAGLRAIGQVQVYRALWLRDPGLKKIEKTVIVCEEMEPNLLDAAAMYGILVFII